MKFLFCKHTQLISLKQTNYSLFSKKWGQGGKPLILPFPLSYKHHKYEINQFFWMLLANTYCLGVISNFYIRKQYTILGIGTESKSWKQFQQFHMLSSLLQTSKLTALWDDKLWKGNLAPSIGLGQTYFYFICGDSKSVEVISKIACFLAFIIFFSS